MDNQLPVKWQEYMQSEGKTQGEAAGVTFKWVINVADANLSRHPTGRPYRQGREAGLPGRQLSCQRPARDAGERERDPELLVTPGQVGAAALGGGCVRRRPPAFVHPFRTRKCRR